MEALSGSRKFIVVLGMICALGFCMKAAPAFAGGEPEVYFGYENFTWKEFDDFGTQIVKESGPRYEVGFAYSHEFPDHITLKPRVEIFGGDVDYNGQGCDVFGNCVPISSTTDYAGFKFEFDVGGKIKTSRSFDIEPFAGFGVRYWSRDLQDSTTVFGNNIVIVTGYTEHWTTFYGRLGLRGEAYFSPRNKFFFEAGVKLPVSTRNYINDPNVSYASINLKPKGETTLFAEAGVKLHVFKISAFYDSMNFKKSNIESQFDPFLGAVIDYWQPRTKSDVFGVRVGAAF